VRERAERMLPRLRYGRVLEVGCGTGFFLLNLWQAGFVEEPHACDISPGMTAACLASARMIGCDIRLRTADAERLPYEDASFDLVVGHAFLHHLPDPEAALREAHRVLAPDGAIFIAGEPTRIGDRLAKASGRLTWRAYRRAATLFPRLRKPPSPAHPPTDDERVLRDLEFAVDLHTFAPAELAAMAGRAGFTRVRTETEELLSSVTGWAVRTIEAEAPPGLLGERWAAFAYRMYLALYAVDARLLYGRVPKDWFYNALLYGEKPASAG
jgi:ubiquinone/menaquinone biosynthesis C-methylase UbiE